jgi:hypothetical protein
MNEKPLCPGCRYHDMCEMRKDAKFKNQKCAAFRPEGALIAWNEKAGIR